MRAGALSDKKVGRYLAAHYVAMWRRVGTFQVVQVDGKTVDRQGGNVAVYFCTPDLEVVNAIAGPVDKDAFLREAQWAADVYASAPKGDREKLGKHVAEAHAKAREERTSCVRGVRGRLRRVRVQAVDAVATTCTVADGTAGADVWQTRVIHGATTTNLCWSGGVNVNEEVQTIILALGRGTDMHAYLGDKGLPKLESIAKDVFQNVLGEVVSDKPVQVTAMDELRELRDQRNWQINRERK